MENYTYYNSEHMEVYLGILHSKSVGVGFCTLDNRLIIRNACSDHMISYVLWNVHDLVYLQIYAVNYTGL